MPKRRTEPALVEALPDGAARRAIREDLSTTILVEAAAGTGKTASLVDRMVGLVASGETTVDRLSAVTFTIRAAAQLKQKFQNALEKELREEKDETAAGFLDAALARLDSCFVGTIHAFGARLLRERPVEAGVDPGFREMDVPEDGAARREAWDRFAEDLFVNADPRGLVFVKNATEALNLVAYIDMMTMLVIFLLMSFSATGEILFVQKNITLFYRR